MLEWRWVKEFPNVGMTLVVMAVMEAQKAHCGVY